MTDNITDIREKEAERLIARDEHDFQKAMGRAREVYEAHSLCRRCGWRPSAEDGVCRLCSDRHQEARRLADPLPSLFDGDDAAVGRADRSAWNIRNGRLEQAL